MVPLLFLACVTSLVVFLEIPPDEICESLHSSGAEPHNATCRSLRDCPHNIAVNEDGALPLSSLRLALASIEHPAIERPGHSALFLKRDSTDRVCHGQTTKSVRLSSRGSTLLHRRLQEETFDVDPRALPSEAQTLRAAVEACSCKPCEALDGTSKSLLLPRDGGNLRWLPRSLFMFAGALSKAR